jgi:chemotaxis protein histidine kinase CheA
MLDVAEAAEGSDLTFQDIAYGEGVGDEAAPEEIADDPDGLYADFEDGSENDAEAEMEAQKDGEQEAEEYTPRANERIQTLVNQRKEAEAQAAAMQAQMQQMRAHLAQQQQAAQQQLAAQNRVLQEQLSVIQNAKLEEQRRAEEADLTDFELWQRKEAQKSQSALQQVKDELRAEFEQKEKERVQQQHRALDNLRKKQLQEKMDSGASKAVEEWFQGLPEEEVAPLRDGFKSMILNYGTMFGVPPAEAAKEFKAYFTAYRKADHKRRLAASKAKPKAPQGSRVVRPATQQAPAQEKPNFAGMNEEEIFEAIMRGGR